MTKDQELKKKLKKQYTQGLKDKNKVNQEDLQQKDQIKKFNNKGIVEGENVLKDNYPVYWDYLYVITFSTGESKVMISNIIGNVKELKKDIEELTLNKVIEIRNCNIIKRQS